MDLQKLNVNNLVTRNYLAALLGLSVLSIDVTYIAKGRLTVVMPWRFEDDGGNVTKGPVMIVLDDKLKGVLKLQQSKQSVAESETMDIDYVKDLEGAGFVFI